MKAAIFQFTCACGHTWQGRKFGSLADPDADLGRCNGCDAPITEAMEAAAVPLENNGPDPRAPVLEAFGITVDSSAEIDALRDLRALVLRVDAEGLDGNRQPNFAQWRAVAAAARAAMTPATFDPARGPDQTVITFWEPRAAQFQVFAVSRPPTQAELRKRGIRARSDRRGLDVVEIEAWCMHDLIKISPNRYTIDGDGWLVDSKGGRK